MDDLKPRVSMRNGTVEAAYEFELLPIARAMFGKEVGDAKKIKAYWALRRESARIYNLLQTTPEDQLLFVFQNLRAEDHYLDEAVRNDDGLYSVKEIGEWMRKEWIKRSEQYWVTKILQTEDDKQKLACTIALRNLYHETTPEAYIVDMEHPSPMQDPLMILGDVNYRIKGEIAVLKAKKKSGKSSYVKIEVACMISPSGKVLGMSRSCFPGTDTIREPYNVLWLDTEQSHATSDKCYRHVLQMAGLPLDRNDSHLKMINLRMMDSKERLERLEEETTSGVWDVVILDGVKDIVKNINDPIEVDNVMARIMQLVQDTKVAFITILHENPAKDTDKMRGWLGTELGNKAFEEQEIKLNKKTGVFTVINTDRREKAIPYYGFRYNEDDQLEEAEPEAEMDGQGQGQNRSHDEIVLDNQTRYCNQVKKAFEDNPTLSCSHADLIRLLIKKCGLTDATAKNRIKTAYSAGVLRVVEGEANKRGAVYALTPQEQSYLSILISQKTSINEDGTIPDIFEEDNGQENGQLDDCPY